MEKENHKEILLSIVRQFVSEFKSERAALNVALSSILENDLGIDSLGRVELFLRIEKAFNIQFPDSLMAESETLNDILEALEKADLKPIKMTEKSVTHALGGTEINPSAFKTLIEVLVRRAEAEPNRPHLYLQDEQGAEEIIRYGQLLDAARKIAKGLNILGLKQGEMVAIMLPTSAEFFYTFFGILLAGGVPVPIYPPLRADRIEEYAVREANILNNAEVRILITFQKVETLSKLLRVFIKSLYAVTTVQALMASTPLETQFIIRSEDPALIQYTSGSTSAPKGVLLTHHNLLSNIRSFGAAMNISPRDVGVSWLPLYHDMGLIGAWLGSVYHAFPLTILSPLSFLNRPERWLWAIHYHRGTLSAGPNFAYELCVRKIDEKDIQGLDLSTWRLAFNGAEAVNPKTLDRFIQKFKPYGFNAESMYPVYGLAENSVALTLPPLNRIPKIDTISREIFEKEQKATLAESEKMQTLQFVSCGSPIPDHEIRIVDEKGIELPERVVGSLQFTGPSAMQGYYRNLDATKAIYHQGWWDSGDYAYLVEGEVYITGRKKDVIIKAGRNLYPQEIEEISGQVPGVRKGCVIAFGTNDPKWGTEKLIVVAETTETGREARSQLIQKITEKVSVIAGVQPDEVVLVSPRTIPKTSSGKLQRSLCKQMYQEGKLTRRGLPAWLQLSKLYVKGMMITLTRYLSKASRFVYTAYIFALLAFFIPLAWLSVLLFSQNKASKTAHFLTKVFLKLSLCPIHIEGQENLTQRSPMIYISNHSSYIDSLLLFAILPENVAFVTKKELKAWPIIKTAIQKLKFLTVDRMDFSKSLEDSNQIAETLKNKRSILIFPEGTFTYASGLRPFKLGGFKIGVDTVTPICPIAIKGTRDFMRGDTLVFSRHPIDIRIGTPLIPTSKEWVEVMRLHTEARSYLAEHCGERILDLIDTRII